MSPLGDGFPPPASPSAPDPPAPPAAAPLPPAPAPPPPPLPDPSLLRPPPVDLSAALSSLAQQPLDPANRAQAMAFGDPSTSLSARVPISMLPPQGPVGPPSAEVPASMLPPQGPAGPASAEVPASMLPPQGPAGSPSASAPSLDAGLRAIAVPSDGTATVAESAASSTPYLAVQPGENPGQPGAAAAETVRAPEPGQSAASVQGTDQAEWSPSQLQTATSTFDKREDDAQRVASAGSAVLGEGLGHAADALRGAMSDQPAIEAYDAVKERLVKGDVSGLGLMLARIAENATGADQYVALARDLGRGDVGGAAADMVENHPLVRPMLDTVTAASQTQKALTDGNYFEAGRSADQTLRSLGQIASIFMGVGEVAAEMSATTTAAAAGVDAARLTPLADAAQTATLTEADTVLDAAQRPGTSTGLDAAGSTPGDAVAQAPARSGWVEPNDGSIFGHGNKIQGRGAEERLRDVLPGEKFFGSFNNFDRAVYGPGGPTAPALEIGQLKSIDTSTVTAQGPGFYRTIIRACGELAGPGESLWEHSGQTVTLGPDTARVLDLALPETPLTSAQSSMLARAVEDAASMGVEIRVHRLR